MPAARVEGARTEHDAEVGFTLLELLVVIIIVGILVAIATPVYLSVREQAIDRATLSDLRHAGDAMTAYYVDSGRSLPLIYGVINNNHTLRLAASDFSWQEDIPITYGSVVTTFTANATAANWCIAMGSGAGSPTTWIYTSQGIAAGRCP